MKTNEYMRMSRNITQYSGYYSGLELVRNNHGLTKVCDWLLKYGVMCACDQYTLIGQWIQSTNVQGMMMCA